MRQLIDVDYLRLAFWAAHTDDDPLPTEELLRMAGDLQALAEDAVCYWMAHGKAPLLAEEDE